MKTSISYREVWCVGFFLNVFGFVIEGKMYRICTSATTQLAGARANKGGLLLLVISIQASSPPTYRVVH